MRHRVNWLVVCSSAGLLLTAMKLPGGSGYGGGTGHHPPLVASEHRLTFAYLPREDSAPVAIPALLTLTESSMASAEPPPLLRFELLANPAL